MSPLPFFGRRKSDEQTLKGEKERGFSGTSFASSSTASTTVSPSTSPPPTVLSIHPPAALSTSPPTHNAGSNCCCCSLRSCSALIAMLFMALGVGMLITCIVRPGIVGAIDLEVEVFLRESYNIFICLSCIKIIFSVLLLIGILREQASMIRPWLIAYFVLVPVELTILVVAAFVAMFADYWLVDWVMLGIAGVMFVFYGFSLHTVFRYFESISEVTIINV